MAIVILKKIIIRHAVLNQLLLQMTQNKSIPYFIGIVPRPGLEPSPYRNDQ